MCFIYFFVWCLDASAVVSSTEMAACCVCYDACCWLQLQKGLSFPLLPPILVLPQVSSLIAERDSMAAQNIALASTTSKLIVDTAANRTLPGSSSFATAAPSANGSRSMHTTAAVEALSTLSGGPTNHPSDQSGSESMPRCSSATRLSDVSSGQQQHHATRTTGILSPGQAREIEALLSRLTSENAAFLKEKDAAVVARDEALNRVTALQIEVEMMQQQFRWVM